MLGCLCALSGCAGNGPASVDTPTPLPGGPTPTGSPGPSLDDIQQTIFSVHCLSAGCHNANDRQGNLVLEPGQSYANLVNVLSFNTAAAAAGLRRVLPGQPDQSFLITKLTTASGLEGSRMPLAAAALSDSDIAEIRDWILAGAPGASAPTAPPTATPSATATDTPSATPTDTATFTPSPTATTTSPPTLTPTGTLPATPTVTATHPPTSTPTTTPTPSTTATPSSTATPTVIATPTFSTLSTLPQIQANIFDATCLGSGCHNATDQAGGQVLEAGQSYAQLVGVVPQNAAAAAAGMLRVDPGNPDNSFLLTKLTMASVFDLRFGSRMPLAQAELTAAQIEQIRAWILRGALPNE